MEGRVGVSRNQADGRQRTTEQYSLTHHSWVYMNEMKVARQNFTPCLHHSTVYLCGGMNPSIEVHNIILGTFTLLPYKLPKETDTKWKTCSVIANDQLVVLSNTHIFKWNMKSQDTVITEKPENEVWSRCQPALYGRLLLVLNGTGVVGISLETGKIVREKTH